jgi:hypothetical protein
MGMIFSQQFSRKVGKEKGFLYRESNVFVMMVKKITVRNNDKSVEIAFF